MKHAKNWFAAGALLTTVASYMAAQRYRQWRTQIERQLIAKRRIAHTRLGPVEYQLVGTGPTILLSHGAPGGYDQGFLMTDIIAAGFSVLTPSRPGYLGTPLYTGRTVEAQADALAALLDTLEIESVVVAGASAGGPIALQLALRHPQRVSALVMMSAVSEQYRPNTATSSTPLARIYLNNTSLVDVGMWLFDRFTARFPARSVRLMLQSLGTVAANAALSLGARAGVVIAGGIAGKLSALLGDSGLIDRFDDHGRRRSYLHALPIYLSIDPLAGLRGAAAAIDNRYLARRITLV